VTASAQKRRPGTLQDLALLRATHAVELIDGEIVEKAMPSPAHGSAQLGLGSQLFLPFNRRAGAGGPGGWWLMTEVEVYYEERQTYRHDVVGWRRERSPARPSEMPVRLRPDWVCEVLSPSNAGDDLVKKLRTLHRHGVPHYWIADPEHRTLTVMRWNQEAYLTVLTAEERDVVRAEPFDAVEFRVELLFERDEASA
jgi:Uma2 family endonuclease